MEYLCYERYSIIRLNNASSKLASIKMRKTRILAILEGADGLLKFSIQEIQMLCLYHIVEEEQYLQGFCTEQMYLLLVIIFEDCKWLYC